MIKAQLTVKELAEILCEGGWSMTSGVVWQTYKQVFKTSSIRIVRAGDYINGLGDPCFVIYFNGGISDGGSHFGWKNITEVSRLEMGKIRVFGTRSTQVLCEEGLMTTTVNALEMQFEKK